MKEDLAPYETLEIRPPGTVLFEEGAPVDRLYFVHSGEVTLSFATKEMLTAGPGELLGLSALVGNRPHESTARTHETCITGAIGRDEFLKLLDEKPSLWLSVLRAISSNINACWQCMRSLK